MIQTLMRVRTILLLPFAGMSLAVIGGVLSAHTSGIVVPHSYAGQTSVTVSAAEASSADLASVGPTPEVIVTYPVYDTTYGSDWAGMITGTASPEAGRTITSVSVAIEDVATEQWWSGSSFNDSSETFVQATGTIAWTLTINAASFTSGDDYSVTAQAIDNGGLVGTSSTARITYDEDVP
jgi:hypothetical protein